MASHPAGIEIGPTYGYPGIGDLDFTEAGAKVMLSYRKEMIPTYEDSLLSEYHFDCDCKKIQMVFCNLDTYEKSLTMVAEGNKEVIKSVTQPHKITAWCSNWWYIVSPAWTVEVTYEN